MSNVAISRKLLDFINASPSMFHAVRTMGDHLEATSYQRLREQDAWHIERGGRYFVTRNNSSVIAFQVGAELPADSYQFRMTAAHSDSPTFKIKAVPELEGPGEYLRLNVESYGGGIDNTWMDKPLSIAGRVFVRTESGVRCELLSMDKDVLLIPSIAIHMNRKVNEGAPLNRQIDLCPLFSAGELKQGGFLRMVAQELGVEPEQILSHDLFLVNRQEGRVWGWADEFVSAPKLDDLQCAFAALEAFIAARNERAVGVFACFDNEEVGSGTKQGALSTFLADTLERINTSLGFSREDYLRALAQSFLVSCDNAHAVHPNHPELTDARNCVHLNKGVVVKESANQRYTTDAFSRALFTALCEQADVPTQMFANRSDMAGGSTLGNLSNMQVSVHAVDIGLPQLAMHSSYETAGVKDTGYAIKALTAFYEADLQIDGADGVSL